MGSDSTKLVRFQWRFAVLVACVAAGVIIGIASVPEVFRITGMAGRYGSIDEAIKSSQADRTNVILLGNSMVMNGLDANQLNTLMPAGTHAWNFSTEGQRLPEAIMIMQRLGGNVKTVVWGIGIHHLMTADHDVPSTVSSRWDFCDFTPCEELMEISTPSRADRFAAYWAHSFLYDLTPQSCRTALDDIHRCVAGRWILKHFIDTRLREILRKDMNMQRMQRDLYFPNPFTVHLEAEKIDALLEKYYTPREAKDAVISEYSAELLRLAAKIADSHGYKLVILLMPEHPYQQKITNPQFYAEMNSQLKQVLPGSRVIDMHSKLGADEFIDVIHADAAGAAKLTAALAEELKNDGGKDE